MRENPTPEAVAAIVKGLTRSQRMIVLVAPTKRYLKWAAIRRHAKIAPEHRAIGILAKMFEHPPEYWRGYRLNALGLAVRQALTGESA